MMKSSILGLFVELLGFLFLFFDDFSDSRMWKIAQLPSRAE